MEAKELRIGNLVMTPEWRSDGLFLTRVETISKHHANVDGKWQPVHHINWGFRETGSEWGPRLDEIKPISITSEWLERFGFENGRISVNMNSWYLHWSGNWCKIYGGDEYLPIIYKIEYVHQLQNLYFALTGNELELK